jgi:hypothetical protein
MQHQMPFRQQFLNLCCIKIFYDTFFLKGPTLVKPHSFVRHVLPRKPRYESIKCESIRAAASTLATVLCPAVVATSLTSGRHTLG